MTAAALVAASPRATTALLPGSPAINTGTPAVCANPPVNGVDQRGCVRPGTGSTTCSIGAYEFYAPAPSVACVGDCNADAEVTVGELVTMVNVALGSADLSACQRGDADADGAITVVEIIGAVNRALAGCAISDACWADIYESSTTMQTRFLTAFTACDEAYRKDASATVPPSPPFSRAAAACQTELVDAFGTFRSEISNLAGKAPEECRDVDLIVLGHLPTQPFGNRWAEIQGVGALQAAYEYMLTVARDWPQRLATMGDVGCTTCATLSVPPCNETACKLAAASGISFDLAELRVNTPLSGTMVLKICDISPWLASAAGTLYVLGGPAKTFDPAPVGMISTLCMTTLASEGLIQCGADPQATNYTACIDHNTNGVANEAGAQQSGTCTGAVCLASSPDVETEGVINGGACLNLTAAPGARGEAHINMVLRMPLHLPGSDCTDAPSAAVTLQSTPLTTGTAQATVNHADDTGENINGTPISGAPFDCVALGRGDGGPVKLVGVVPTVNKLEPTPDVLLDTVTGFTLECE